MLPSIHLYLCRVLPLKSGRVDDSVEEEIRRLKAEEESRVEALKRDKTEVKKEVGNERD